MTMDRASQPRKENDYMNRLFADIALPAAAS